MQHEIKQIFLIERLLELFHKDTIDSYRIRIHNTNSLLKELRNLITGFVQNRVNRFETVRLCAEELFQSLKSDSFLNMDNYSKELFLDDLEKLIKSDGHGIDFTGTIFNLDKLLQINRVHYIDVLFDELQKLVFDETDFPDSDFIPVMEKIDQVIVLLASELINIGFSKSYVFYILNKIKSGNQIKIKDNFIRFRSQIQKRECIEYTVIFKIYFYKESNSPSFVKDLLTEVPDEIKSEKLKTQYPKFNKPEKYAKLVVFDIHALDNYSAIKMAKDKLSKLFDKIHVGYNSLDINVHSHALVIRKADTEKINLLPTNYSSDGIFESNEQLYNKYDDIIQRINNNAGIEQDVSDRLNSALRYLRLGNSTVEIEQKFIDYWIALEFIFSSPIKEKNTFGRLKENMLNILSCCYLKRNMFFLTQSLQKGNLLSDNQTVWGITESELNEVIEKLSSKPLLRYRLQKAKSNVLGKSDKREKYLKNHIVNLNQNLSRIYHLRNELIHEAALKQDIESITSNLRYYLVFVLNQLLYYFSNIQIEEASEKQLYTMDDLFYEFKNWKKIIEKKFEKEQIFKIPLDVDLLNKK